jgi:hypothetical protein
VSIHADDEFSLKTAFESELDDVVPEEGLAVWVIERYRKGRRRRIAGAVGLFVVCAGIGVPFGLGGATGSGQGSSSPAMAPGPSTIVGNQVPADELPGPPTSRVDSLWAAAS